LENSKEAPVLSKRNNKLLDISKACEIIAWIVLVIYCVYGFLSQTQIQVLKESLILGSSSTTAFNTVLRVSEVLKGNLSPMVYLKLIVDLLTQLLQGVLGFLTLYGISYGLKMLVETDVNYRLNKSGDGNE